MSNAVPLASPGKTVDAMDALLEHSWTLHTGPLNFVMGIAFDYDADSLPDTTNATFVFVNFPLYMFAS